MFQSIEVLINFVTKPIFEMRLYIHNKIRHDPLLRGHDIRLHNTKASVTFVLFFIILVIIFFCTEFNMYTPATEFIKTY